jgi:fructan beta-fructosidase
MALYLYLRPFLANAAATRYHYKSSAFAVVFILAAITAIAQPGSYREQYRPQFHFSPPTNWMNDPNGMFYDKGEYHLFYQYYPDGNTWGPMHWGHAVSKDLVNWQNLPIALYPDSLGYIFSGSAVVDRYNTSGLGINNEAPIIAIYTYHNMPAEKAGKKDFQYQGIAYSNDKGRTWKKYQHNPVLPNTSGKPDFRDPKVCWHTATKKWIMTLAVKDKVEFWGSSNLLEWNYLSNFGKDVGAHGGVWECPDLFPMTVKETGEKKWVLLQSINPGGPNGGSATQYFVGDFDGSAFSLDASFVANATNGNAAWVDYGRDNYAGVSWSNVPAADGRHLFIGWMSNWDYAQVVPTTIWRSAMTIPRSLVLHKKENGYLLCSEPVRELKKLRSTGVNFSPVLVKSRLDLTKPAIPVQQSEWMIDLELNDSATVNVGVELSNTMNEKYSIGLLVKDAQFYSNRMQSGNHSFSEKFAAAVHTAPRIAKGSRIKLHLFIDASSVELFADDGTVCMTDLVFPTKPFTQVQLVTQGGTVKLLSAQCYALKRIWK